MTENTANANNIMHVTNNMILRYMRNKQERESFLTNYQNWGIWKTDPDLELTYYKADLPDGSAIVVTEYASIYTNYSNKHYCFFEKGEHFSPGNLSPGYINDKLKDKKEKLRKERSKKRQSRKAAA